MGYMKHADLEGIASFASEDAFEQVWAPRDWERLGAAEVHATEALGRGVKDVAGLSREELIELNAGLGIVSASGKIEALRKNYVASFGDVEAEVVTPATSDTTSASASASQNKE